MYIHKKNLQYLEASLKPLEYMDSFLTTIRSRATARQPCRGRREESFPAHPSVPWSYSLTCWRRSPAELGRKRPHALMRLPECNQAATSPAINHAFPSSTSRPRIQESFKFSSRFATKASDFGDLVNSRDSKTLHAAEFF